MSDTALPIDSSWRNGTLENGFRYFIRPHSRLEDGVYLELGIKAGSECESETNCGTAHFLEHMLFQGTEHYPEEQQIIRELEGIGCSFGLHSNASTGIQETRYTIHIPNTSDGDLAKAIHIISDMAQRALIRDDVFQRERGVILDEMRRNRSCSERTLRANYASLFYGTRYANCLPIGTEQCIQTMTPATLRDFYAKWYRPDRMALAVCGQVDPDRVSQLVKEHFASFTANTNAPGSLREAIPQYDSPRFLILQDPELSLTNLTIRSQDTQEPKPTETVEDLVDNICCNWIEDVLNNRFRDLSTLPDTPWLSAGTFTSNPLHQVAQVTTLALPKENRELESLSHIVAELQRLQTHGILEEELEEVRSEYLRFIDTQQRHSAQLDPSYFTDCAMDAFYEDLLLLDFDKATALKRNIAENLTLERVHSMLDAYAPIPNSHVCLALPLAANADRIHQGELEAAWTSGIESAHTPPTRTPSPPLAPVELPAGTVDMETETCPHTGAETLTFSNGIRVTLYPMEDAPDHIRMKAMAKGGHACLSEPDSNAAVLANAWLAWAGIGGCRRQTLEKLLNGKEVSLERQIGATKRSIKGQCKMEELDEFLGLLHLLFSYKEEDEELFYFVQQRTAEFRKDLHRSPSRLFQYAVQALNSSGSPIMQELRTSDILGCRYENVQELAHAAFSRAADFHFTFSGDFDPDLIKPLLAEYLGKLPTRDESQRWAALSEEPQFPTHITTQSLEAGIDAKARLQISFPAPKDFEHRSLVERGLCAQILKKRLLQKLRFEDGVTYSVGVGLQYFLRPLSDYGTMGISLVCAPEDIDAVERSIIEALNELISEGCTESELEEVRQSWLIERARERSYAQKASNALTQYQMNHWDPSDHASVEDWAKELTLADVKQHLAVLLPLDNYTVMRQVPEARTDGA